MDELKKSIWKKDLKQNRQKKRIKFNKKINKMIENLSTMAD
jgi:hypothetical protein